MDMSYFPENKDDWVKIASLVEESKRIFISTHINPDGDAIGSVIALAGFFSGMGKAFRIVNDSKTPVTYQFLDPECIIETCSGNAVPKDGPIQGDLVILLDLGNYSRLGKIKNFLIDNEAFKVVIDHHIPEPVDADIIVLNTRASSTGSLVYDFMSYYDSSLIDKRIACALMTAIISDTGFFRYSNTTTTTHLIVSELYKYDVNVVDIRKKLETGYLFCRQKLMGLALANTKITSCGRMAYSIITNAMFEKAGAQRENTEGIIDQIRIIKDIKVASLIIQEGKNQFKASFRTSDNIPANEIASRLGGGGHPKAAGANVNGSLEEVTSHVIEVVTAILNLKENKND